MRLFFIGFFTLLALSLTAQRIYLYSPNIKTLQWQHGNVWTQTPVLQLNSDEQLTLSFDVMSHESLNLRYAFEHCSSNWQTSELHTSEFLQGLNTSLYLPVGEPSLNTDVAYTHYTLTFPNSDVNLRLSGNYKIHIYTEDSLLLTACFSIVEPMISLSVKTTSDTYKGHYDYYQQLDVELNHLDVPQINNAREELLLVAVPNGVWAKQVYAPPPSAVLANGLRWTQHPQLLFEAGNEYRKFEILHSYNTYQGVEHIEWQLPNTHAYLYKDTPRTHYLFDKDLNGQFLIRNEANKGNTTESQYMIVHFALNVPERLQGTYYVVGAFNDYHLNSDNRMYYDPNAGMYRTEIMLKQGYYNYAYAYLPHGLNKQQFTFAPIEGNFHQTENSYEIYVYHRNPRLGYDALIGYTTLRTTP